MREDNAARYVWEPMRSLAVISALVLLVSPFLASVARADGGAPAAAPTVATAVGSAPNDAPAPTLPPEPVAAPHMHSPGMLAGGVTLLVIGAGATATGAVLFAKTGCTPPGESSGCVAFDPLPEILLPVGISSLVVGGLLTGFGAVRDPVTPTVSLAVGMRSVVLFGTF